MADGELLRRATVAALERGMQVEACPGDPNRACIWCPRCGWNRHPGHDQLLARYAAEPFRCPHCAAADDDKAAARGRIVDAAFAAGSRRKR